MKYTKNTGLIILMLLAVVLTAQNNVLYFVDSNSVHLRWNGIHRVGLEGYKVFRHKAGEANWTEISGTIKPLYKYQDLKKLLDFKTGAYLQLYGIDDKGQNDITIASLQKTFNDPKAVAFLGVMSLTNPEFAAALGEIYEDRQVKPKETYEYKISYLEKGEEKELVKSEKIDCSKTGSVPVINNLEATADNAMVRLTWNHEAGYFKNADIVTFNVYRSDNLLGPFVKENYYGFIPVTFSTSTAKNDKEQYKITYLENDKTYFFTVKGVNAFGIESMAAPVVECTPHDNTIRPPSGFKIMKSGSQVKLSWNENTEVEIFRSVGKQPFDKVYPPVVTRLKPIHLWYDNNVQEGFEYSYFIRTLRNEARSNPGDTLTIMIPDITPPAAPVNVKAESKKGLIIINWDINKEPDILGYEVERASDISLHSRFLLTGKPITQNLFRDSINYKSQTLFGYFVYAIDKQYNRSKPSEIVTVKLPDFDPPSKPYISSLKETDTGIALRWVAGDEKDIAGFFVYRATKKLMTFSKAGEAKSSSFLDMVKDSGTYVYAVTAVDSAGNESAKSASQAIAVLLDKGKLTPVNGSIEQNGNKIIMKWQIPKGAAPDGFVVTRIEPSGKILDIGQLSPLRLNFTDYHPVKGKLTYEIRSRNANWQMGRPLRLQIEYKP